MPSYYNPYMNAYPMNYTGNMYSSMPNLQQPVYQMPQVQQPQYMITVDGENAAKSWQPTVPPQANTIIPIFDSDGQHVYFKTFDSYGRMNPVRKGRIVFDDEIQVSGESAVPDFSNYVTKDDMESIRQEIRNLKASMQPQTKNNQNGNNNRG